MTTREQLASFHTFAINRLDESGCGLSLSLEDLFQLWRSKHPTGAELTESVSALAAAYQQLLSGEEGVPARVAVREDFNRRGWTIDE